MYLLLKNCLEEYGWLSANSLPPLENIQNTCPNKRGRTGCYSYPQDGTDKYNLLYFLKNHLFILLHVEQWYLENEFILCNKISYNNTGRYLNYLIVIISPGFALMNQLQLILAGYSEGQPGLVIIPLGTWICSGVSPQAGR